MNIKKIIKFSLDNYFISIFIACILFVGVVSVYKLFFARSTYVYAKIKMGQGLWWANTVRPSIWFVQNIKKGDIQTDLTGKPIAEILEIRYYPYYGSSQFDTYITLHLKVSGNKKTGKYNFQRSTIGVGSPIDLEFPSAQFSGTVIEMSDNPIKNNFVEKNIILIKRNAYPWEYDAIKVGDAFFDGQDTVFKVIDKQATDTSSLTSDNYGNSSSSTTEGKKYITVKAKIKCKLMDNQLVYGEDQIINLGKTFNVSTSNFTFSDYQVSGIE